MASRGTGKVEAGRPALKQRRGKGGRAGGSTSEGSVGLRQVCQGFQGVPGPSLPLEQSPVTLSPGGAGGGGGGREEGLLPQNPCHAQLLAGEPMARVVSA